MVNLILQKSLSLAAFHACLQEEERSACFGVCATRSQANIAPNYLVELQDRFGENGIGNSGDFPDVLPVAAMRLRPRYRSRH